MMQPAQMVGMAIFWVFMGACDPSPTPTTRKTTIEHKNLSSKHKKSLFKMR
jgi:hypothetical protein